MNFMIFHLTRNHITEYRHFSKQDAGDGAGHAGRLVSAFSGVEGLAEECMYFAQRIVSVLLGGPID